MNVKQLKDEYAAMPADVRNGEAGQALAKKISRKKVLIAGDNLLGAEAVKALHASRQISIAELKRQLKPMPVEVRKVGANRNLPCPCGSGRKFKKCCFFLDKPIHITP